MHANEFIEQTADGQRVETLHEPILHLQVVQLLDLPPKIKVGGHRARLVVAAQHHHGGAEVDLHREEQQHHFHGEWTPVHLVAHEQLVVA